VINDISSLILILVSQPILQSHHFGELHSKPINIIDLDLIQQIPLTQEAPIDVGASLPKRSKKICLEAFEGITQEEDDIAN
jgi:hypothetical protein